MDGDDLFSNFNNPKRVNIGKNDKSFIGKKRNTENPIDISLLQANNQQKIENSNLGQNLEIR